MIYLRPDILMVIAVAACLAAALAIGVASWWWSRKLGAHAARLAKSDQARQFTSQQLLQARKQIEGLKAELAARPRPASAPAAVPARTTLQDAMAERKRLEAELAKGDLVDDPRGRRSAHGFENTQVLARY